MYFAFLVSRDPSLHEARFAAIERLEVEEELAVATRIMSAFKIRVGAKVWTRLTDLRLTVRIAQSPQDTCRTSSRHQCRP
jgi:hypothetical protein